MVDATGNICDDACSHNVYVCSKMINRRRIKEPRTGSPGPRATHSADVQRALRLGWTVAETFGRVRVYHPEFANKRNDPHLMPRFSYSNTDLSGAQQLEVSYRRLVELAGVLGLNPPDVPALAPLLHAEPPFMLDADERKAVYDALEGWSRRAWIQLNVRSAALGRAMTYGGSLADTYWYMAQPDTEAFLSGRQSPETLLRPHRLRRMQERMDEIKGAFSANVCDAIGHSLGTWAMDERKAAWAKASTWAEVGVRIEGTPLRTPAQHLHFILFRQARSWRALLLEASQPSDYLSTGFQRRANLLAGAITVVLVVLVALATGVLVFATFTLGLGLVHGLNLGTQFQNQIIEALSVLVTVISAIAVLVAGLFARARRAVEQFDTWLEATIVRRRMLRETTVPWNDPPRRAGE